ncbi:integrase [Caballeronia glebae]|uniref:integrase n=1 Tax=Caballeronia glebae TaxID=1777143 RepID=UPI0038B88A95
MSEIVTLAIETPIEPASPPEEWHRIAEDTIVTRDGAGLPKSLFRDDAWDVEAYGNSDGGHNVHFRDHAPSTARVSIVEISKRQWKQVMYFLMHEAVDEMPAPSTIRNQMAILRSFVYFAAERDMTLYEAVTNVRPVLEFAAEKGNELKAQRLHAILVHIHRLGPTATGLQVQLKRLQEPMLAAFGGRQGGVQYPVIPTRVYQHFLATCERELAMVEAAASSLEEQLRLAYAGAQLRPSAELSSAAEYFGYHRLDSLLLSSVLTEVYTLCQVLILAFTGMRATEASHLPYHCLSIAREQGVEHYVIEGVTTKLSGGREKRARWVTSHLAVRAVKLAQRISGVAHSTYSSRRYQDSTDGSHLLFCRFGLVSEYKSNRGASGIGDYIDNLRQRAFPLITQEDVAELKRIDPHRAWEAEAEFAVGSRWPFTRHQLRRTLALYAHRSGLVTLPSLKRQLQHITAEMSLYYARGSAFAKSFLDLDKKHFAQDWDDAQGLSEYLAYAAQVLFSDERLFGGHAAWVQSNSVKSSPVSVFSREKTIAMFNKGELAYKETVLGGCASVEPCKSSPLNWLPLECLEKNCKSLVIVPSKLARVVKSQERRVETLESVAGDSVEYRMEKQALDSLVAAQQKATCQEPQ